MGFGGFWSVFWWVFGFVVLGLKGVVGIVVVGFKGWFVCCFFWCVFLRV